MKTVTGYFRCRKPLFQSEAKCEAIDVKSWVLLSVVETIVGSLLCRGLGIVKCLLKLLYC